MSAVDRIRAVLDARLLLPELTIVPTRGATDDELQAEESLLGRRFCEDHALLLKAWNGIALEVVRFFGCGVLARDVGRLLDLQLKAVDIAAGAIVIGSDASGFVYFQLCDGRVFTMDTDGGEIEESASNLDDFVERLVLGPDAALFAGQDWLDQLRTASIVQ